MRLSESQEIALRNIIGSTSAGLSTIDGVKHLTFSGFSSEGRAIHAKAMLRNFNISTGDVLERKKGDKTKPWDRAFSLT